MAWRALVRSSSVISSARRWTPPEPNRCGALRWMNLPGEALRCGSRWTLPEGSAGAVLERDVVALEAGGGVGPGHPRGKVRATIARARQVGRGARGCKRSPLPTLAPLPSRALNTAPKISSPRSNARMNASALAARTDQVVQVVLERLHVNGGVVLGDDLQFGCADDCPGADACACHHQAREEHSDAMAPRKAPKTCESWKGCHDCLLDARGARPSAQDTDQMENRAKPPFGRCVSGVFASEGFARVSTARMAGTRTYRRDWIRRPGRSLRRVSRAPSQYVGRGRC